MMIALYILGGLATVFIVLMLVAPKEANVERSIEAGVSQKFAFQHLRSLEKFDVWSPWGEADPNMERGYKGTDGEVGSIAWWKGNKEVGEGEQEVKVLKEFNYIETELRFLKPFKATNKSYWKIEPKADDSGVKVTWGFHAKFAMPMNIMMMFMSMDSRIGKDFEKGLAKWKSEVEKA